MKRSSVALCLDVDRDAPFPFQGKVHAISHFLRNKPSCEVEDASKSMLTQATVQGLEAVLDLVEGLDIPLNLFFEGRIADFLPAEYPSLANRLSEHKRDWDWGIHGYDHEDFMGKDTGIRLSEDAQREIIRRARKAVCSLVGCTTLGFRAPYTRLAPETLSIVEQEGLFYDSSLYVDTVTVPRPYRILGNLWEVPIAKVPQKDGQRLYLYLWTLFEGTRTLEDHIQVVSQLLTEEDRSGLPGILTLNLHPWHIGYSIRLGRYASQKEFSHNVALLERYLSSIASISGERTEFASISRLLS